MDNLNIKNIKNVSLSVTELGGINKRKSGSGSLYSALNMTADHLPFLKQRGRRAVIRRLSSPQGLCGGDTLIYADGGRLYFGGDEIEGIYLSEGEKTLLRVGKYLVVMPDRVYYNLDDPSDLGQMNVSRTASYARICCVDKELSELDYTAVAKLPGEAEAGMLCALQGSDGDFKMKRYDGSLWKDVKTFLKLEGSGIGIGLRAGDTVAVSSVAADVVGEYFKILHRTDDALYCDGCIGGEIILLEALTVSRKIPLFDHACISGGRLVGVRRGRDDLGRYVSRVYASAENDPFDFAMGGCMLDVDISGAFTGVCDYLGSPVAFSESEIIELRIKGGALIGTAVKGYGVCEGGCRSISCIDGALYYLGRRGVCRYDGSYPELISDRLCEALAPKGGNAPGETVNGKYYIKTTDTSLLSAIYVYDTVSGSWMKQDDPGVDFFAVRNGCLYALCDDGTLMLMDHDSADEAEKSYLSNGSVTVEERVDWSLESSEIGAESLGAVSPVRLTVRLKKADGASVKISTVCDGSELEGIELPESISGTFSVPIPLRRCDSLRLKISGSGECTVCGYELEYRAGGRVRCR